MVPAARARTKRTTRRWSEYASGVTDTDKALIERRPDLGRLLLFVPAEKKDLVVAALRKENILAAHIGTVLDAAPAGLKRIFVER